MVEVERPDWKHICYTYTTIVVLHMPFDNTITFNIGLKVQIKETSVRVKKRFLC